MRATTEKTWGGYKIVIKGLYYRPLYVGHVRDGKMKLWCDYAHARPYTLKTAQKHVDAINKGLYNY